MIEFTCYRCVRSFRTAGAHQQHNRDKHGIFSSPANHQPPHSPAQSMPQVFAQLNGCCVQYDLTSYQGRATSMPSNLFSIVGLEVHFTLQTYTAAAGDSPVPYVGQILLMENVTFCSTTGRYWAGSVRDYRGYTTQLHNQSGHNPTVPPARGQTAQCFRGPSGQFAMAGTAQYGRGQNVPNPATPTPRFQKNQWRGNGRNGRQRYQQSYVQPSGQIPTQPQPIITTDLLQVLRQQMSALAMEPETVPVQVGPNHIVPYNVPPTSRDLRSGDYQEIIALLQGGNGMHYVGDGIGVLRRTRQEIAESLWKHDPETRRVMLITLLSNEMDTARVVQANAFDASTQNRAPTPPTLPQPTTFYCSICLDDESMADIFIVSSCGHTFCRDSIKQHILSRMDAQDASPVCPYDGCMATMSDADMNMVLTVDEQQRYYDMSLDVGAGITPDTHKCLVEGCRGVVVLNRRDTHFRCPIATCRAERCVTCNTRQWHDGQTCEQYQQQARDNELQPEQLRNLFSTGSYMCRSCRFGPILHGYCSNLQTHHGQAVGGSRISNACPQCGWFSASIGDWPAWDGVPWGERNA